MAYIMVSTVPDIVALLELGAVSVVAVVALVAIVRITRGKDDDGKSGTH